MMLLRSNDSSRTFVTLDGLRGIAALAIAARHDKLLWSGPPHGIFYESYLAVDFFFVLSGFVLAHAYGDRIRNGMSARQFMSIRLIRLYQLYFVSFIIGIGMAADQLSLGKISSTSFVSNGLFAIIFIHSVLSDALFPMNMSAWSLFFELVANFLLVLIGKRLNTRLLVVIVLAAALTLLLAVSFSWLGFGTVHGAMDAGMFWRSFGAGLAHVTYSFFAGVLAYRLWKVHPPKMACHLSSWLRRYAQFWFHTNPLTIKLHSIYL